MSKKKHTRKPGRKPTPHSGDAPQIRREPSPEDRLMRGIHMLELVGTTLYLAEEAAMLSRKLFPDEDGPKDGLAHLSASCGNPPAQDIVSIPLESVIADIRDALGQLCRGEDVRGLRRVS